MLMPGTKILLESLRQEGVDVVFGYPGGAVLPLYDKLNASSIRHYLVRHEQNACFAAEGYARSTGKVGVCFSTSGPGATNLITGLTDAYMDSIPVVAITGQVPTSLIGSSAFQEADTTGMTRSCTKHNYLVQDASEIPTVIREAFHLASSGRPGPVLVDMPKNVLLQQASFEPVSKVQLPGYKPTAKLKRELVSQAAAMVWSANRPVIYAGGGIIHAKAGELLQEFAEMTGIPAALTVMGLGAISSRHELNLGMLGMHGSFATNSAINQADLIIALGVRFDDRVTGNPKKFARGARFIHVDTDPAELNKIIKVDLAIHADVREFLLELNQALGVTREEAGRKNLEARQSWRAQISEWGEAHPLAYDPSPHEIKPQFLMEELDSLLRGEAIVSADVGQHQMWAAQYLRFNKPRYWLNSGGLGSMGFGLPAAIGAAVANPDKTVVALIGDGGFQMSLPELGTLATYKIPVKIIVVNNQYLGMVRQWQELFYNGNYSEVEFPVFPDCEKLAASYGLAGQTVENPSKLKRALQETLFAPGPYLLDVRVSREENVYPIVPSGAGLDEMILYPNNKNKILKAAG